MSPPLAASVAVVAADLDICVNSVGGGTLIPLLLCDARQFMSDLTNNLLSTFLTLRHPTMAMAAGGGGSYISISSDSGGISFPFVGTCGWPKPASIT